MEIKYYDYYSGAVPHPVTSAQFSVHHAACWFQGRQDADRTQTEHRQGTDRTQKGHRQNTDRTQIGHRQNTEHRHNTDRKQTGHRQDTDRTQTENRQDTDRTQTGHRQNTDRTQTGHRQNTPCDMSTVQCTSCCLLVSGQTGRRQNTGHRQHRQNTPCDISTVQCTSCCLLVSGQTRLRPATSWDQRHSVDWRRYRRDSCLQWSALSSDSSPTLPSTWLQMTQHRWEIGSVCLSLLFFIFFWIATTQKTDLFHLYLLFSRSLLH